MSKLIIGMRAATNYTTTDKGALTHKSTLNPVLDYYYQAPAMRGRDTTPLFSLALATDQMLALRAMFYVRDIRGGGNVGERETFRQALRYLHTNRAALFTALIPLVPEYGRWDDLMEFVGDKSVVTYVAKQLQNDREALRADQPISMLAKWMPSANTSSKETRALAYKWITALHMTPRDYRLTLSALRKRLNIVERAMSSGDWSSIDYSKVPSKASLIYRSAFGKRDTERYGAYLSAVEKGEAKINSGTLYPYELVGKYLNGHALDRTIEAQWSALPNFAESEDNALVIADVSGSMRGRPLEVSISLAIYFAERNRGIFHDYFLTFSTTPELTRVIGNNLREKVNNLSRANWDMSTNVQAAFNLILKTAVANQLPEAEMPKTLFIISDMQFDSAVSGFTNFQAMKVSYAVAGYTLPKLVFWNVNASENKNAPVTELQEGVYLVAGSSAGVFKTVLTGKTTTPYDLMVESLMTPRYDPIEAAVS